MSERKDVEMNGKDEKSEEESLNKPNENSKKTRMKNKKKRQKERKKQEQLKKEEKFKRENENGKENEEKKEEEVIVEYVEENLLEQLDPNDPMAQEFAKIYEKFNKSKEEAEEEERLKIEEETKKKEEQEKESDEEGSDDENKGPSKKERKKQGRISVAVLKQLVSRPDVVEAWDVTSSDPKLLVSLKSYRNSVPVPRHWNQKRKYLQGKRGIEKAPFALPDFIAATGISKIRNAVEEDDDPKKGKAKQREKLQPKLGKMDIAYEVLQDAFYRFQTKPKLTVHGDLYFEGKEFEITMKEKRPGLLSDELKKALGMPEGSPPPWIFAMQRVGPPPSYPNLKIPGVNAPIPEHAKYGFHPGGWGKPQVDDYGRPLYGDPFGVAPVEEVGEVTAPIEKKHWGELEEMPEEEMMEEEAMEQEEEGEQDHSGTETPSGFITPSGVETPEVLQLRKAPARQEEEEDDSGKQLYQVIQQTDMSVGNAIYGSSHRYVLPGSEAPRVPKGKNAVGLIKSQATEKLEVTLDPSEVENLESIDQAQLLKKYEQVKADKQAPKEDLSDIVKEQLKKRKKAEKEEKSKKAFKF